MICAWDAFESLLPAHMRKELSTKDREELLELRLRSGQAAQKVYGSGSQTANTVTQKDDIAYVINAASRYSPWTSATMANGYITAQGGHRIGVCGEAVVQAGQMQGIRTVTSICIRIARDFPGIAPDNAAHLGSVLIIGPPGCGKTTLLRDMIRKISSTDGCSVAVVDERGELFPSWQGAACFSTGKRTDIMTLCNKTQGIEAVLRTMGPTYIAVDEITAKEDCAALTHAGWCGVRLLATAHAETVEDIYSRPVYKPLAECGLFDTFLVLDRDKSWHLERMRRCTLK